MKTILNPNLYHGKRKDSNFFEGWYFKTVDKNKSVSVTCSLATIPFPIKDFRGFLIGLTINGKFISFTTINNSKLFIKNLGKDVELVIIPLVKETLSATVEMILEDTQSGNILYRGIGQSTGIEYGGTKMYVVDI